MLQGAMRAKGPRANKQETQLPTHVRRLEPAEGGFEGEGGGGLV